MKSMKIDHMKNLQKYIKEISFNKNLLETYLILSLRKIRNQMLHPKIK